MISYRPLWETMKAKNFSQYKLLQSGIDNKTLDGLKKGKNITLHTLEKLCNILDCEPGDIFEFTYTNEHQAASVQNDSRNISREM